MTRKSIVLIIGDHHDEHVKLMHKTLVEQGNAAKVWDTSTFPQSSSISMDPEGDIEIKIDDDSFLVSDIRSVYWRSYKKVKPRLINAEYTDRLSLKDSQSLLNSALQSSSPKWFNSYTAWDMHKYKPTQLKACSGIGVTIPKTLITNNPDQAMNFYRQHNANESRVIYKPVFGGAETQFVESHHMEPEYLSRVFSASPVTLQAFVNGVNIRTYVVGKEVISAEILTDELDFRTDKEHTIRLISTPGPIHEQALNICKVLHLRWTAIDWIRTDDGTHYFLEANPSPMFIGFSINAGVPIHELLIKEMIAG